MCAKTLPPQRPSPQRGDRTRAPAPRRPRRRSPPWRPVRRVPVLVRREWCRRRARPAVGAGQHPPAGGGSLDIEVEVRLGVAISVDPQRRQAGGLAHQPVEAGAARLFVGVRGIRSRNGARSASASAVSSVRRDRRSAHARRRAAGNRAPSVGRATRRARPRGRLWRRCASSRVAHSPFEHLVERAIGAAAQRRQAGDGAIEMRAPVNCAASARSSPSAENSPSRVSDTPSARRQSSNTSSTSASQNWICAGRRRGPLA